MMQVDLERKDPLVAFPDLRIREADGRDHAMLARMNLHLRQDEGNACTLTLKDMEARFERFQTVDGYTVEVFVLADAPVGFVTYRIEADDSLKDVSRVYIRQFFITRDMRRTGLGRACLELLLDKRVNKPNTLRLEVLETNPNGLAFWIAAGFSGYSRIMERQLEA